MSKQRRKFADLRYATTEERRFALAYLGGSPAARAVASASPPPRTGRTACRRPAASRSRTTSSRWCATPPNASRPVRGDEQTHCLVRVWLL
jgi:hypothetical protein